MTTGELRAALDDLIAKHGPNATVFGLTPADADSPAWEVGSIGEWNRAFVLTATEEDE